MGHFCLIWVFFCLLLVFFSRNYACYWCWFGCCCYCCFYAPSCLLNVLLLLFGCFLLLLLLMLFLHVYVERIHIYWTNLFRKIICLNQEHMTAKPISTKQLLSWFRTNNYALFQIGGVCYFSRPRTLLIRSFNLFLVYTFIELPIQAINPETFLSTC